MHPPWIFRCLRQKPPSVCRMWPPWPAAWRYPRTCNQKIRKNKILAIRSINHLNVVLSFIIILASFLNMSPVRSHLKTYNQAGLKRFFFKGREACEDIIHCLFFMNMKGLILFHFRDSESRSVTYLGIYIQKILYFHLSTTVLQSTNYYTSNSTTAVLNVYLSTTVF
jgi:hypothetical protein